jgi:hypothetical protein
MTEVTSASNIVYFQEIDEKLQQIQKYTMKIEDAKVNLKILKERQPNEYQKYLSIQGKQIPKTKEEKEKELKMKQEIRQNNQKKNFFDVYKPPVNEISKDLSQVNQKSKYDLDIVIFIKTANCRNQSTPPRK